jgi:hypothetical protein
MEGHFDPVFSSIEEWLGSNTEAYYRILAEVGQGQWRPQGDALPWVRFCLLAHHQQAARHIRRNEEYGRLYERIEAVIKPHGLHERVTLPLFDVALGLSLTNTKYRNLTGESQFTATRDLKVLTNICLLEANNQGRGRTYVAGAPLKKARAETRIQKPLVNPYDEVRRV